MRTIYESARVTFGSGDRRTTHPPSAIFFAHIEGEERERPIDADQEWERLKPIDRLMRQTPQPR